jgi:hypothetical protein
MTLNSKQIFNAALVAGGLVALWFGLAFLLSTNRGLDLTDEGLYLLAADPPSARSAWGFPFGWHTGAMFKAVGYDIGNFRTLGALLLVLAGGWLGWSAISFALKSSQTPIGCGRWLSVCGALTGAMGSLLYYGSLLSTPSYNWLNLFGLMIAAGGYLKFCAENTNSSRKIASRHWLLALTVAVGIFVTIPAKPSSAPLVFVLGSALVFVNVPLIQTLRFNATVIVFLFACVFTSVLVGLWRWPLVDYFTSFFHAPKFVPDSTVMSSVWEILMLPVTFYEQLIKLPAGSTVPLYVGISVLAAAGCLGTSLHRLKVALAFLALFLMVTCCLSVAAAGPWTIFRDTAVFRFSDGFVTSATLLFVASILFAALAVHWKKVARHSCSEQLKSTLPVVSAVIFLTAIPFVFAFGSGNTPYRLAAMASGVFLVAALVACVLWPQGALRSISSSATLLFTLLLLTAILKDSYIMPYRNKPMALQTENIKVGRHNAMLRVDGETARTLVDLRDQAERAGWMIGTPLLGAVWDWASTVPYFLGARVPDCLMLTLFSFPTSVEIANYNISNSLKDFPSNKAWILTSNPRYLTSQQAGEIQQVLESIAVASKRRFPQDYHRVAESGNLQLWKPKPL